MTSADGSVLTRVKVDPTADIPIYAQIRNGIQREIDAGRLGAGQRLPTVNAFARRYGISTKTVMQALNGLSDAGSIQTRRGARSVVAEQMASSTEIMAHRAGNAISPWQTSFFDQLLEGLRDGYAQPGRRFWLTFFTGGLANALTAEGGGWRMINEPPSVGRFMSGQEILRVCEARRADSLIIYRPQPDILDALRVVAECLPVVSVFNEAPGSLVDCVLPDPSETFRRVIAARIQGGHRSFAYIGIRDVLDTDGPYLDIYRTFLSVMEQAGIDPIVLTPPGPAWDREAMVKKVGAMPDDTVLVMGNPTMANVDAENRLRCKISYTECLSTLNAARGRVTTLYVGIERAGIAAAKLCSARVEARGSLGPRRVALVPEVIETA